MVSSIESSFATQYMGMSQSSGAGRPPPPPPPSDSVEDPSAVKTTMDSFASGELSQDEAVSALTELGLSGDDSPFPGGPTMDEISSGDVDLAEAFSSFQASSAGQQSSGIGAPPPPASQINTEALETVASVLEDYDVNNLTDDDRDSIRLALEEAGYGTPGSLFDLAM